jgi:selenide,water dikinase
VLYCSPSVVRSESGMQQLFTTPARKRLVLLGGGHSHLAVLMYLAKNPLPGLDITLVSKDIETPYSGALPAYITGAYGEDDLYIDLRPLAVMAGARIVQAQVERLDLAAKEIHCPGRPPVCFDYLSINIGSRPDTSRILGAQQHALAVKPIDAFLHQWQQIREAARLALRESRPYALAIVGGGPASVEMACAFRQAIIATRETDENALQITIITSSAAILSGHSKKAQALAAASLADKGISVRSGCEVTAIEAAQIHLRSAQQQEVLHTNCCVIATGASPAKWLADTGLAVDEKGFLQVNSTLQSTSHPWVFAAGDIASISGYPRPKSGVYAVRQGLPLAKNLRRFALGQALLAYRPQRQALALLSMGDGSAIASRGRFALQGGWVARWKDSIDRAFVSKYSKLPDPGSAAAADTTEVLSEKPAPIMHCAGCAAKLSSSSLSRVLGGLHNCNHMDIETTLGSVEDTSIIRLGEQRVLLQSVDHLRAFINDPYLFARIATNHCLSDIHAMGAKAHSALAIVNLPHGTSAIMEEQLQQVMTGCTEVLNLHNTALIGGHTSEAESLSFGLSVNAFADPEQLLRKTGMQGGDLLILSKALGTGTLFAADMRYRARHRWIANALVQMQRSNEMAAHIFLQHGATACTDVTGFGLLGHLGEMIVPQGCEVSVQLGALPALDGALTCFERGIFSSLHADNAEQATLLRNAADFAQHPHLPLLFDPQTAGGLLASVPAEKAAACIQQLHDSGHADAVCIGRVISTAQPSASVQLEG